MNVDAPAPLAAFAGHAAARPEAVALYLPRGRRYRPGADGFRAVTYGELDRRTDALAAGFTAIGIGAGVRTVMLVPPSVDFFAVAFGLLKAAAVPVLVDPGLGLRNLRACLREAEPVAFVGVPRAHAARRALRWCPEARLLVTVGAAVPMPGGGRTLAAVERAGAALPVPPAPTEPAALAAIAFTSGSTGVPKGVEYTAGNFAGQLRAIRAVCGADPGEVSLATFPPFALLGPLLGLCTVVPRMDVTRPAKVDPRRIVDAARTFAATVMFGSPALVDTVSRWGANSGARMPTLRRVISAGAPVSPAVQRRMLGMLAVDAEVHTPYGATEALPVTSIGSRELLSLDRPGVCVGRPAPDVEVTIIRIRDDPLAELTDDLKLPAGEVGEIVVRGPNVTGGYAHRPAATAAAKIRWDGAPAHRMGDLGYVDELGRLWFCGRKAQRVTTVDGPLFTSPTEEILNTHPAVRRSALVGVGAPGVQRPVICIELEPAAARSARLTADLLVIAAAHPETASIRTVLYHRGFPVDIRHNAKINREALARWAARRLA